MGNCCCGAAVESQHSPNNTKPSSPVVAGSRKNNVISNQNGLKKRDENNNKNNVNSLARDKKDKENNVVKEAAGAAASSSSSSSSTENIKITIPRLRKYSFAELKSATRNFKPDTILGEGGFGRVFKGWVDENTYAPSKVGVGIAVAVKKANSDSPQGFKEWQSEVNFLGKFTHPNLVKLLGFCWEEKELLLVYEYMQKGSLENHLFRKGADPLPWDVRLNIAIGAARGLAFLHTSEKKVIYRDFKTSNILLDGNYNARLSDFGLAKLGPSDGNSHVTTLVMGTYGYAAPEYVATGHLYVKSDVYGFGVVLLEMLTGLRALDTNRPGGQHNLVEWAKPSLSEKRKLKKIMDKNLEDQYPLKGAYRAAELILKCLESDPKNRPSMEEVLETLEKVNAIKVKQKEIKASPLHPIQRQHQHQHQHQSPLHHHYQNNHHQRNNHNNLRSPIHPKHGNRNPGGRADHQPSTSRPS